MSPYRVELRPAAVRAMRQLDRTAARRIQGAIALLATEPRPPAARAVHSRPGFRVRIGDHGVIYTIDGDILLISVVTLAQRREAYKQ